MPRAMLRWILPCASHGPALWGGCKPSVLAANLAMFLAFPLSVMQEQNAFPGRTNLLLSRLATAVCVGFPAAVSHFPASARSKCIITGNPVRKDLLSATTESGATTLPVARTPQPRMERPHAPAPSATSSRKERSLPWMRATWQPQLALPLVVQAQ